MIGRLPGLSSRRACALVTALVVLATTSAAWAYFSSTGSGTAAASTGSLSAPTGVTATPGAGTVALHWNAVTPPASGAVTYYVTRSGGAPAGNCPTPTSPASVMTCTDSGLTAGIYQYTVTAVWRSWTATSSPVTNVTLISGAASKIVLSGSTANLASATTRTFTATIEDAAGNTVTSGPDATDPITFAQTAGAGTVTGLTTVPAVAGVATDTITGKLAGSVSLQAGATLSGPGLTNSNTQTFTITFGTATQIALSGSTANLASATTRTFTATIEDAAGNTVTSGADSTDPITFAQTAGAGTVTGLTTVPAVAGVATDTITGKLAGPVTLQANGNVNGSATNSNTQTFTVVAGTATTIVLSGSTANLASATTRTFTATIEDAAGNTVTSGPDATDPITFAQTAGAGTVTGLTTVPAVAGVATDTITGKLAGSVSLQAGATLSGPGLTNSNTQTFTITFGTATQIALSGSTANLASATTRTFTATIEDAAGNTVTSGADSTDPITFAQTAGAGTVTGLTTVPAVAGVATDTITGKLAGPVTLQANGNVNGSATNSNTQTFTVVAGTATTIAIVSGSGQSASTGSAFANPLVALVTDANGNPVSGVPVTFAAPSSGASGTFATCAGGNPATYQCVVTTNSSGDATSSTFSANATTGSYNVAASASSTNTVNFAISNVADVLVITSAPVSGSTSATGNLGPITVQLQTTGGTPVNAGSAGQTVNLSGPTGSSFAASQFGTSVTSVTIPSGSSSTTFWYGNTTAGTPTITASGSGLVSGTQKETITTAPVGLGIVFVSGTGTPVVHCGTPSSSYACTVSGVGNAGSVTFYVTFVNSSGTPVVYSSSQSSTITDTAQVSSSVTIAANASSSSPNTLTASHDGNSTKTSTLTFGPYTLTIAVSS